MSENETAVVKKRNPRPTNLSRATSYTTTDGRIFLDKKEALRVQKGLDLVEAFESDPIADGVTGEDMREYVARHKAHFFALLRSLQE